MNAVNHGATVDVHWDDKVCRIGLNRPHALNALNVTLLDELTEALTDAQTASAVVLYGHGRAFCVGEDLRETLAPASGDPDELRRSFERLQQLTRLMTTMSAPIVAAVQGYAVGGGAELALSADLIVGSTDLKMRFPEVPIGHAVTGAISIRLAASIGLLRAKDLLLRGRWIDSDQALQWGILTEQHDNPVERAEELGAELAQLPRRSMAATKRGVELAVIPHQETVFQMEIDAALHCFSSTEAHAAYRPFQKGPLTPDA